MTTNEFIALAKSSVLAQLPVNEDTAVIRLYVELGLIELYKRFNLSIKTEAIQTVPETALYELRSPDINQVLALYNSKGEELLPITIIGSRDYDYKQLNYRTFLFAEPKDEFITFVYKAAPANITDFDEELPIPPDMTGVLLDYVGFRAHSTINKDNVNEANVYHNRFEKGCMFLEQQGYRVNLNTACHRIQDKGFI
jgi:hypothetical protein